MQRLVFLLALAAPVAAARHEGCEAYRIADGGRIERHSDGQSYYVSARSTRLFAIREATYARILELTASAVPAAPQVPHVPTRATLPQSEPDPTYPASIATTKTVQAGGNYACSAAGLSSAISDFVTNRATWGTTELRIAPACSITLTAKITITATANCSAKLIIRSGSASVPAQGTRYNPATDDANAAHIVVDATNTPAFELAPSSCGIRFGPGLDVQLASGRNNTSTMFEIGDGNTAGTQNTVAEAPDDIWVDRSRVGCTTGAQECAGGIAPHAKNSGVVDSYLDGFTSASQDAAAVRFWNTPGPLLIQNNYGEGSSGCVFAGGAPMPTPGDQYNPSDITIRRNYCKKPLGWATDVAPHSFKKAAFEIKTCVRCLIEGNVFENNWVDGQNGQCWNVKTSNSGNGNTWARTQHLTFRYNICRNMEGEGFGLQSWPGTANFVSSFTSYVTIEDNLFDGVSNGAQIMGFISPFGGGTVNCTDPACGSDANKLMVGIFISHITVVGSTRNHASFRGAYSVLDVDVPSSNGRCSGDSAMHNSVLALAREGATATNSSDYHVCKLSGVRDDTKAWSHDYDSLSGNLLTNANAAACTTPNLSSKSLAQNPLGCATTQGSQYTTFSAGNIGLGDTDGTPLNDYRLLATSAGYQAGDDAASRTALGLSTDAGADIGCVEQWATVAVLGTGASPVCGAPAKPTVPRGRPVPRASFERYATPSAVAEWMGTRQSGARH